MNKITELDLSRLSQDIQKRVDGHYAYLTRFMIDPVDVLKRDFDIEVPKGYSISVKNSGETQIRGQQIIFALSVPKEKGSQELSLHELDLISAGLLSSEPYQHDFLTRPERRAA